MDLLAEAKQKLEAAEAALKGNMDNKLVQATEKTKAELDLLENNMTATAKEAADTNASAEIKKKAMDAKNAYETAITSFNTNETEALKVSVQIARTAYDNLIKSAEASSKAAIPNWQEPLHKVLTYKRIKQVIHIVTINRNDNIYNEAFRTTCKDLSGRDVNFHDYNTNGFVQMYCEITLNMEYDIVINFDKELGLTLNDILFFQSLNNKETIVISIDSHGNLSVIDLISVQREITSHRKQLQANVEHIFKINNIFNELFSSGYEMNNLYKLANSDAGYAETIDSKLIKHYDKFVNFLSKKTLSENSLKIQNYDILGIDMTSFGRNFVEKKDIKENSNKIVIMDSSGNHLELQNALALMNYYYTFIQFKNDLKKYEDKLPLYKCMKMKVAEDFKEIKNQTKLISELNNQITLYEKEMKCLFKNEFSTRLVNACKQNNCYIDGIEDLFIDMYQKNPVIALKLEVGDSTKYNIEFFSSFLYEPTLDIPTPIANTIKMYFNLYQNLQNHPKLNLLYVPTHNDENMDIRLRIERAKKLLSTTVNKQSKRTIDDDLKNVLELCKKETTLKTDNKMLMLFLTFYLLNDTNSLITFYNQFNWEIYSEYNSNFQKHTTVDLDKLCPFYTDQPDSELELNFKDLTFSSFAKIYNTIQLDVEKLKNINDTIPTTYDKTKFMNMIGYDFHLRIVHGIKIHKQQGYLGKIKANRIVAADLILDILEGRNTHIKNKLRYLMLDILDQQISLNNFVQEVETFNKIARNGEITTETVPTIIYKTNKELFGGINNVHHYYDLLDKLVAPLLSSTPLPSIFNGNDTKIVDTYVILFTSIQQNVEYLYENVINQDRVDSLSDLAIPSYFFEQNTSEKVDSSYKKTVHTLLSNKIDNFPFEEIIGNLLLPFTPFFSTKSKTGAYLSTHPSELQLLCVIANCTFVEANSLAIQIKIKELLDILIRYIQSVPLSDLEKQNQLMLKYSEKNPVGLAWVKSIIVTSSTQTPNQPTIQPTSQPSTQPIEPTNPNAAKNYIINLTTTRNKYYKQLLKTLTKELVISSLLGEMLSTFAKILPLIQTYENLPLSKDLFLNNTITGENINLFYEMIHYENSKEFIMEIFNIMNNDMDKIVLDTQLDIDHIDTSAFMSVICEPSALKTLITIGDGDTIKNELTHLFKNLIRISSNINKFFKQDTTWNGIKRGDLFQNYFNFSPWETICNTSLYAIIIIWAGR